MIIYFIYFIYYILIRYYIYYIFYILNKKILIVFIYFYIIKQNYNAYIYSSFKLVKFPIDSGRGSLK